MANAKEALQKSKKFIRPVLMIVFLVLVLVAGGLLLSKEGKDAVTIAQVKKNAL